MSRRTFAADDGTNVAYLIADPNVLPGQPKFIIGLIHGIGLHGGAYSRAFELLSQRSYLVTALDLRGHGYSGGSGRNGIDLRSTVGDIRAWIARVRQMCPEVPFILMGESMGTVYALNYASQGQANLAGLVLVSPVGCPSSRQILGIDTLRLAVTGCVFPRRPLIDLTGWRLDLATDNQDVANERRHDRVALSHVSLAYLASVGCGALRTRMRHRPVRCPVLVLYGTKDRVLSPGSMRRVARQVESPRVELREIPGANHMLMWEDSVAQVISHVADWCKTLRDQATARP